jgi:hypothetical protein
MLTVLLICLDQVRSMLHIAPRLTLRAGFVVDYRW